VRERDRLRVGHSTSLNPHGEATADNEKVVSVHVVTPSG
jgi:hypothetical protein